MSAAGAMPRNLSASPIQRSCQSLSRIKQPTRSRGSSSFPTTPLSTSDLSGDSKPSCKGACGLAARAFWKTCLKMYDFHFDTNQFFPATLIDMWRVFFLMVLLLRKNNELFYFRTKLLTPEKSWVKLKIYKFLEIF